MRSPILLAVFSMSLAACGGGSFVVLPGEEDTGLVDAHLDSAETDTLFAATKDGAPETDAGKKCEPDLSYVDAAGNFTIALSVETTSTKPSPLLNQRPTCSALQPFWDLQMLGNGVVDLQIGGSGDNVEAKSNPTMPVNDGALHRIVLHREGSTLFFIIDGKDAGKSPFAAATGKLSPLKTGETDKEACPMEPFVGKISDVCLSRS